jgi:hypothetical protein
MPRRAIGASLVLFAAACSGGRSPATAEAPAPTVNVAGRWAGVTTVGGAGGRQEFTLLLLQEGDSLRGELTIEGSAGRRVDGRVTGALSRNRVTWTDGARAFKFHGTVKGDRMAGVWAPTYVGTSTVALSLRRQPAE